MATRRTIGILALVAGLALLLVPLMTIGYGTIEQSRLRREFSRLQAAAKTGRSDKHAQQSPGEFFPARIVIRKIGLDQIALHGTAGDVLAKGPGHYDKTVEPGEKGLSAFAGHRVTFSHPFNRVDELSKGDLIVIQSPRRPPLVFSVTKLERVDPSTLLDLKSYKEPTLALTTCDPKYSARYRLIVYAKLEQQGSRTQKR